MSTSSKMTEGVVKQTEKASHVDFNMRCFFMGTISPLD